MPTAHLRGVGMASESYCALNAWPVTPALSSAMLESTTIQAVGTRKIVQFTILADVRMPGGAS